MGVDVVIGYHGKPRCAWAGGGDTAFGRYHDEVWGLPHPRRVRDQVHGCFRAVDYRPAAQGRSGAVRG